MIVSKQGYYEPVSKAFVLWLCSPAAEGWVVFGRGSAGGFYVGYKKGRPQTAGFYRFF